MVLQRNMSLSWLGEQAQSQFLDRNLENHEKSQQRDDRDHHEGCSSSDSRGSGDGGGGGGGGGSFGSQKSFPSYQKLNSYNSLDLNNYDEKYTIRHQVIVWNVGTPDVKNNRVSLMFRVTLFWNDPLPPKPPSSIEKIPSTLDEALKAAMADSNANANANAYANANANANVNAYASAYDNTYDITTKGNGSSHDSNKDDSVWVMEGRNKAVRKKTRTENKRERNRSRSRRRRRKMSEDKNNDFEDDEEDDEEDEDEEETIDVPPVSIINAADFEIIGRPDITCLRYNNKPSSSSSPSHSSQSHSSSNTRLMRFSCMYRASLLQEAHSMNVAQFPHDTHDLIMKLGILSQRQPNGRWDRRKWKLGLANESDTQGSIRVPYGVLVDHVAVPGFQISDRGLEFELSPIEYGNSKTGGSGSGSGSSSNGTGGTNGTITTTNISSNEITNQQRVMTPSNSNTSLSTFFEDEDHDDPQHQQKQNQTTQKLLKQPDKQQYGSFIQNNFQQQRPNPNKQQQQQQQQNQNQNQNIDDQDFCVKTKIRVKRNSAYYDRNIMPLLDILNLVSISILVAMDATNFFQRGLMCLNIAFLEIGLRTSLDARLPSVGYEIKMQKILNSYFYSILYIVLESAIMKVLLDNTKDNDHTYWTLERTRYTDHITAFLLLINQFYLRMIIYKDFSNNNNNNNNNYDNTSSSMSNTNNSTNKNSTNASGKGDGDGDEFK